MILPSRGAASPSRRCPRSSPRRRMSAPTSASRRTCISRFSAGARAASGPRRVPSHRRSFHSWSRPGSITSVPTKAISSAASSTTRPGATGTSSTPSFSKGGASTPTARRSRRSSASGPFPISSASTRPRNETSRAVDHLISNLKNIAAVAPAGRGVTPLILDGENAWEAFPDGGESFLSSFYRALVETPELEPVRIGDYFDAHPAQVETTFLHSGSWIRSDFDIWIGDPEENKGWEWLKETRHFLVERIAQGNVSEEHVKEAWWEIYAAEGSDWFWWYGPDFTIDNRFPFRRALPLPPAERLSHPRRRTARPPRRADLPRHLRARLHLSATPPGARSHRRDRALFRLARRR